MSRTKPLSGYPEFLPAHAMIEQRVLDTLRGVFELHGFGRIETRAVEPLSELSRKGEITKEVYAVKRLHAAAEDAAELGLHFDLTVPFARYVLENAGQLQFPFRRYQMQKVWRGERPQEGRYREFLQCDIDVIGRDTLATHHDAELPLVALEALEKLHVDLGLPPALMHINNRKLLEGFYQGLGIEETAPILQRVDKLDKIGPDGVRKLLTDELALSATAIDAILGLAQIQTNDESFVDQVHALGVTSELMETGLVELSQVLSVVRAELPERVTVDLRIARGLDYYTGMVQETELVGWQKIGAVSGGGRYDALARDNRSTYPGVGLTIGVTRILVPLLAKNALAISRQVPSAVFVAVDAEDNRSEAQKVAASLRRRGISCEIAPKSDKFGKQIAFADKRGIPYVWFGGSQGSVKDIRSGEQVDADATVWSPADVDLIPQVTAS
ncbi:MAG: histidine--tRNA ligase [Propionibacteriaceae bacterium]